MLVRGQLFAADDAQHTLSNLMGHGSLARVDIVLELGIVLTQALTALWFYRLFRGVDTVPVRAAGRPLQFRLEPVDPRSQPWPTLYQLSWAYGRGRWHPFDALAVAWGGPGDAAERFDPVTHRPSGRSVTSHLATSPCTRQQVRRR